MFKILPPASQVSCARVFPALHLFATRCFSQTVANSPPFANAERLREAPSLLKEGTADSSAAHKSLLQRGEKRFSLTLLHLLRAANLIKRDNSWGRLPIVMQLASSFPMGLIIGLKMEAP